MIKHIKHSLNYFDPFCLLSSEALRTMNTNLPLTLVFLWHVLAICCIHKGAVDLALSLVKVDLVHLSVAEERWPTFDAMLGRFSQIYIGQVWEASVSGTRKNDE